MKKSEREKKGIGRRENSSGRNRGKENNSIFKKRKEKESKIKKL